jgi:GH18 family chitinase
MRKLSLIFLFFFSSLQGAQIGDTLKYRVTYYPTWAMNDINPWEIDWGGITHIILFSNGSTTNTSPYWLPVTSAGDSIEIEYGPSPSEINILDSLVTKAHREGRYVMTTIQCVGRGSFDYIATDSTRTQVFHDALKAWMLRKHIDGWDLDLEGEGTATRAECIRFLRIGRRVGYHAQFPNGRALMGIAAGRDNTDPWPAAQVDSMLTFYDMQGYTYQWMWDSGNSNNATWFQSPVASPASCGGCQNSSMSMDYLYGGDSFIHGYIDQGHDPSKFVFGYSTSCVTGFTGTNQLSVVWSDFYSDNSLVNVEDLVNHGGTWTHDATAKASYIAGTATAGNAVGLSAGTQFFFPFEDSTDMKAGIDYLKSVGAGGVMFYDIYGDRRIGATPAWKRTPYIYAASMYAQILNGGGTGTAAPVSGTKYFGRK